MLPFLKPKKSSTVMVKTLPDGDQKHLDEMDPGLMSACEEMISAMHAKDATALAHAMQAAFMMMDLVPHEEYDHASD